MTKIEATAIDIGQPDNAYGLYILLDDNMERMMQEVRTSNAKHKVDILVVHKDEKKEFSFKQFLDVLGFKEETPNE